MDRFTVKPSSEYRYVFSNPFFNSCKTQGNLARKKFARKIFKICLSLSFHNYKIDFKVRISFPHQTLLVDGSNRK